MISARIGTMEIDPDRDADSPGGETVSVELEMRVWRAPRASIGFFVDYARHTAGRTPYANAVPIPTDLTEVGARLLLHPHPQLGLGIALGFSAYREPDENYYGLLHGVVADATVVRFGHVGIVTGAHAELGGANAFAATIGLAWIDGTPCQECRVNNDDPDPRFALRLGYETFSSSGEDASYGGSSPAIEAAVDTPIGQAHIGGMYFSQRSRNVGADTFYDASYKMIALGLRSRWRVMPRITVGMGGGLLFAYERDHTDGVSRVGGGPMGDAIISIRIARVGSTAIEAFERLQVHVGTLGLAGASSMFGLGVSYGP
jgi:hypothetical protein